MKRKWYLNETKMQVKCNKILTEANIWLYDYIVCLCLYFDSMICSKIIKVLSSVTNKGDISPRKNGYNFMFMASRVNEFNDSLLRL